MRRADTRTREQRDADRARKEASGRLKAAVPAAVNGTSVETAPEAHVSYGELFAGNLIAAAEELSGKGQVEKEAAKFLALLAEDTVLELAEPGAGIQDYFIARAKTEAPMLSRPIVIAEIKKAREKALNSFVSAAVERANEGGGELGLAGGVK